MQRRKILKLALTSAAIADVQHLIGCGSAPASEYAAVGLTVQKRSESEGIAATVQVDWATSIASTTPCTFGSNDYEITDPEKAADPIYQQHLAQLGIGLIRIHHAELSDRWSNPTTQTWDVAKIQAGYDRSYPQKPVIIQNIPGAPAWMKRDEEDLLSASEHDRYARFCAELVQVLNQQLQQRVLYWEPLNEQDVAYQKAGRLEELWALYNKVAIAMKAVDPSIKVGGPALTWDEPNRLSSFLQACAPQVDFISWHRYGSGDATESTDTILAYTPEYGVQVEKFRTIARQLVPDRLIPLLLGEYNINYAWDSGEQRQHTHIGAVWFASVLKHLATAGIEMATSWHLKDGIYGMIDPDNHLRPVATVFDWGVHYLVGQVMLTQTSHPLIEALAVGQMGGTFSLLLINKSAQTASLQLQTTQAQVVAKYSVIFTLDANGIQQVHQNMASVEKRPLMMPSYSLALLRFSNRPFQS